MESIRYFKVNLDDLVNKIKYFFKAEERDIDIVILFGSILRREIVRDIDIAIYSTKELVIDKIFKLGAELEDYLDLPVDLISLNETPPKLKAKILTQGLPIIIKNQSLYAKLLKKALGEKADLDIKIKNLHRV